MNGMRTELKGLYQDLERQVAERTQELSKTNEKLEAEIVDRQLLAQEAQLMADIGRIVSSSLDISEVYQSLTDEMRKLIPFDRFSIGLVDRRSGTMSPAWVLGLDVLGRGEGEEVPLAGSLAGEVFHTRSPMMLEAETEADLEHRFPQLLPFYDAGLRSFMAVPLSNRDAVIGVLRVGSKENGIYFQHHLELLERIGSQIAGAIANSLISSERQLALQETRTLAELGRIVSSSLDVGEIYERFAQEVQELIQFDRLSFTTVDRGSETVTAVMVAGFTYKEVEVGTQVPMKGSLTFDVLANHSPMLLQGATKEHIATRYPSLLPGFRLGARSWLSVPLINRDEVIGSLNIVSKMPHAYTQDDVTKMERVGYQVAGAMANAQLYADLGRAESAIRSSLNEKEVLLKEINHRVKNNLQIISSLLHLQSRDIHDEQALRSFQVSQDRIRAMALVHEKLYQSDDLARIDFGDYIESLATDLGSSYGLGSRDVKLKIDVENILLGVDTAIPCGVIVNEMVANSLKHGFPGDRSGQIAISFREADGQYTMIFKDDGVGFPEDLDISHPSSLGLTIVNAVTGQLGGTIGLGRNGGSEIRITFPARQTKGD